MTRWASPELISAAISDEEAALERLIGAVWPGCFRLAASLLGDRNLAQDAAQESCVIVHRKLKSLRDAGAFDAWLYRIVAHEAARVRRRYANASSIPYDPEFIPDDSASVDIWRALAQLAPPLREVTVLFYFDDLKTDDIAAILRIPHATVRTRLLRARERLRSLLDDYDFEPHPFQTEVPQHAC